MQKAQTLTGFYVPGFLARPDLLHAGMQFLVDAAKEGKVRPSIDRILPLSETAEGRRFLEEGEVYGTIVLDTTCP